MDLTSTHEDYIEAVFRHQEKQNTGIRISDLALELGCRMPTVSRTVRALAEGGYFNHESRGEVTLTEKGQQLAIDIAHRHDDVVSFLTLVLGLKPDEAESCACQLEHGFSALAAQRLHNFMDYVDSMPHRQRQELQRIVKQDNTDIFNNLVETKTQGWRI
jgi:DtxR family Mn-dependent transcriptional regulator